MLAITGASIGPAFALATIFGPMVVAGGGATPVALLVVTAIMACVAIAYQRLGARYPTAGSAYSWVGTAFGPAAGAYAAWLLIVANIFAVVAICVPAGTYTLALVAPAFAGIPAAAAAVGALWALAGGLLLASGLHEAALVTKALWIAEMSLLGLGAITAFIHPVVPHAAVAAAFPGNAAFLAALVIGIWMIDGWEVSASTAEETTSAQSAGIGGFAGLLISAAVLLVAMLAFMRVGTLDGFTLHEGDTLAYVAGQLGGAVWQHIVTATVLVSLAATLQTTLVYLTRSFYAMGRDGVLPAFLGELDARDQPARATVLITAVAMVFTLGSGISPTVKTAFDFILSGTSAFLGFLFVLAALAACRLFAGDSKRRASGVFMPAAGALSLGFLLVALFAQADPATRAFILVAAALGVPLAVWRGRLRGRTTRGGSDGTVRASALD